MQSDIDKLSEISSAQWGLITTAQAELVGVGRLKLSRYAEKGLFVRLSHGVYRDAGAFETVHEEIKVAWLSIYPSKLAETRLSDTDIIVGGTTAAMMLGCGDMEPYPYQFYTQKRRQTQRDELTFIRRSFEDDDFLIKDGLPVARIEFVIADLIKRHYDLSLVLDVFKDARAWLNNDSIERVLDLGYLEEKLDKVARQNQFKSGNDFLEYMLEYIKEGEKEYGQELSKMFGSIRLVNNEVYKTINETMKSIGPLFASSINMQLISEALQKTINENMKSIWPQLLGSLDTQPISDALLSTIGETMKSLEQPVTQNIIQSLGKIPNTSNLVKAFQMNVGMETLSKINDIFAELPAETLEASYVETLPEMLLDPNSITECNPNNHVEDNDAKQASAIDVGMSKEHGNARV